jgi:hypothetical protein
MANSHTQLPYGMQQQPQQQQPYHGMQQMHPPPPFVTVTPQQQQQQQQMTFVPFEVPPAHLFAASHAGPGLPSGGSTYFSLSADQQNSFSLSQQQTPHNMPQPHTH